MKFITAPFQSGKFTGNLIELLTFYGMIGLLIPINFLYNRKKKSERKNSCRDVLKPLNQQCDVFDLIFGTPNSYLNLFC